MWRRRLIAASIMVGMFAVPMVALAKTEAPDGVRHTIEVHGQYDGCKWTQGWAHRVFKHEPDGPGPEQDPNYVGKMWDFKCRLPIVATVTQTVVVTVPGGGSTQTVTVTPTPTPTQTETQTTPPPTCEPSVRSDHEDECEDE